MSRHRFAILLGFVTCVLFFECPAPCVGEEKNAASQIDVASDNDSPRPAKVLTIQQRDLVKSNLEGFVPVEIDQLLPQLKANASNNLGDRNRVAQIESTTLTAFWTGESLVSNLSFLDIKTDSLGSTTSSVELPLFPFPLQPPRVVEPELFSSNDFSSAALQRARSCRVPIDENGRYWFAWSLRGKSTSVRNQKRIDFVWPKSATAKLVIALPRNSQLTGEDCVVEMISGCPDDLRPNWFGEVGDRDLNWYRVIRSSKSTSALRVATTDEDGLLRSRMRVDNAELDFQLTNKTGELTCQFSSSEFAASRLPRLRIKGSLAIVSIALDGEFVQWSRMGDRIQIDSSRPNEATVRTIQIKGKFALPGNEGGTDAFQLPIVSVESGFVINGITQVTTDEASTWLVTDSQHTNIVSPLSSGVNSCRYEWRNRSESTFAKRLSSFPTRRRVKLLSEYRIEQDRVTQRIFVVADKPASDSFVLELTNGWKVETVQSSTFSAVPYETETIDDKRQVCFFGGVSNERPSSAIASLQNQEVSFVVSCSRPASYQGIGNHSIQIGEWRILNAETIESLVVIDSTTGVTVVPNSEMIQSRRDYGSLSIELESIVGDLTSRYIHDGGNIRSNSIEFRFEPPEFESTVTTSVTGRNSDLQIRHIVQIRPLGQKITESSLWCSGPNADRIEWYYRSEQKWIPAKILGSRSNANRSVTYEISLGEDAEQDLNNAYALLGISYVSDTEFDLPRIEVPAAKEQDFVLTMDESVGLVDSSNFKLRRLLCFENPMRDFGLQPSLAANNYQMNSPGLQKIKVTRSPAKKLSQPFFKDLETRVIVREFGGSTFIMRGNLLGCDSDTRLCILLPNGFTFQSFDSTSKITHRIDTVNRAIVLDEFQESSSDNIDFEIVFRNHGQRVHQSECDLVFPAINIDPVQHSATVLLPHGKQFVDPSENYFHAVQTSTANMFAAIAESIGIQHVTEQKRTYVADDGQISDLTINFRSTNHDLLGIWLAALIGGFTGLRLRLTKTRKLILVSVFASALAILLPPNFFVLTLFATLIAMACYGIRAAAAIVRTRLASSDTLAGQYVASLIFFIMCLGASTHSIHYVNAQEIELGSELKQPAEPRPLVVLPIDSRGELAGDIAYVPLEDFELLSASQGRSGSRDCFIKTAEHRVNLAAITVFGRPDEFISEYTITSPTDESVFSIPFDSETLSLPSIRLNDATIANSNRVQIGVDEIKVTPGVGDHKLVFRFLLNGYRGATPKQSILLDIPSTSSTKCTFRLSADRASNVNIASRGVVAQTPNGFITAELGAIGKIDVKWNLPTTDSATLDEPKSRIEIETYLALDDLSPLAVTILRLNGTAAKKQRIEFDCSSNWRPIGENWSDGRFVAVGETDSLTRSRYTVELTPSDIDASIVRVLWAPANRTTTLLNLPRVTLVGEQPNDESLFFASSENALWELDGAIDWVVRDSPADWPPELLTDRVNSLAFTVPDQPSPALLRRRDEQTSLAYTGAIAGLVSTIGIDSTITIQSESERLQKGLVSDENILRLPPGSSLVSVLVDNQRITIDELEQLRDKNTDSETFTLDIGKLLGSFGKTATIQYQQRWPNGLGVTAIDWQLPSFSNVAEMGVSVSLIQDAELFIDWEPAVSDFSVAPEGPNTGLIATDLNLTSPSWAANLMLTNDQLSEFTTLGTVNRVGHPFNEVQLRLMNIAGQWVYECYANLRPERAQKFNLVFDLSGELVEVLTTDVETIAYDIGGGRKRVQLIFENVRANQERLFQLNLGQITPAGADVALPEIRFVNVPLDRLRVVAPKRLNGTSLDWIVNGLVALDSSLTFFLPQAADFSSYRVSDLNYTLRTRGKRTLDTTNVSSIIHRELPGHDHTLAHTRILTRPSESSNVLISNVADEIQIVQISVNGRLAKWTRNNQQLQTRVPYADVPCVVDVYWRSDRVPNELLSVPEIEGNMTFVDANLSSRSIRSYTRDVLAAEVTKTLGENERLFTSCSDDAKAEWLDEWRVVWQELDEIGELSVAVRTANSGSDSSVQNRKFSMLAERLISLVGRGAIEQSLGKLPSPVQSDATDSVTVHQTKHHEIDSRIHYAHYFWARLSIAAILIYMILVLVCQLKPETGQFANDESNTTLSVEPME